MMQNDKKVFADRSKKLTCVLVNKYVLKDENSIIRQGVSINS